MKVLCAMDGGAPAEQALALLKRAAAPEKAQITVVSVDGMEGDEGLETERGSPTTSAVAAAAKQLEEAGFQADGRLLRGRPAPALLNEIEDGGCELAVLGAGNRSRLDRLLFGSVSTKVLHASPTSVLIVHRFTDDASPLRVLFGADGSDDSDSALEQLLSLLDPSACRITVLCVAEHLMPQLSFPVPRVGYATSAPTPEQEDEWIAAAHKTASAAADKLEGAGFTTEARAVLGAPASRVLDAAQEIEANLVVVGSRGLGAVDRAALGSVSDQIAREADATFVGRGGGRGQPARR
jgi:nucleotide-binding universal stress UspA family protein